MDIGSMMLLIWFVSVIAVLIVMLIRWEMCDLDIKFSYGVICTLCPVLNSLIVIGVIIKILYKSILCVCSNFGDFFKSVIYNFWDIEL